MAAARWAHAQQLPITLLGRGSNVLIDDAGIPGLVICMRDYQGDPITRTGDLLTVPAGLSLPKLAKTVANLNFSGYEFYIGIPGTVGGAIVMNAGYGPGDERQTANRCVAVKVATPDVAPQWLPYAEFAPGYRQTAFLTQTHLWVLAAQFRLLQPASAAAIRAETAVHLAMRKKTQPLTRPTAGSVFAAADGVPAAVTIDRCGLKGLQVGGAMVSPKHANWIENTGNASAADVRELIQQIQAKVLATYGVALHPEVRCLP